MKKITTFLLTLAVALGFSANAQILYKVEKKGSSKTSYLLGTHHFAPLSAVDSISELPEIMKGIDLLYGELDMSAMSNPAAMMGMQQKMMAPADSTIDKVLSATQLDSLKTAWTDLTGGQVPLEMLYGMKPAVISTQIAAILSTKVLPELNPMEGIDVTMQNRARELDKPVAGLESLDFQIDMLYGRPIAEQANGLMETLSNIDTEGEKAIALSKAYLNHDIEGILQAMLDMEDNDAEAAERMIYSRNDSWVNQLSKEMPEKSLLVVVGAGHLPGPRGVIEGLRKAGFTITPIK